jgi:RNA polymerase sigma-70 factor (ECF subfamily)
MATPRHHPGERDLERLLESSAWVQSLAASLASDPSEADDLVQETWLAALRSPPRKEGAHRSWLRRVVGNFTRLGFRNRARRLERERLAASPEAVAGPEEAIERAELTRRLVEKVLELEEPGRTVVLLRYFEGLTGPEIAARLGIRPGAVRMRLKRALDQLRRKLGDDPRSREAWWALLPAVLAAPGTSRAAPEPGCLTAAHVPPGQVAPGGTVASFAAKAAIVVASLGAGCLIGGRPLERAAEPGVPPAVTTALEERDSRIRELEEKLDRARSELEQAAAWRLDIERRIRSTRAAVARLSLDALPFAEPAADPA